MSLRACIKGIGAYLPPRIVPNAEFEKTLDTSDEWIQRRTGIKERRFADCSLAELAERAARQAIARARLEPSDIDAIIVATLSPEHFCMPSTAVLLAERLGLRGISAFDVSAACAGFVYALETARALVVSGAKRHVLIVGAEKISSVLDFSDRSTCVLFGDGAGAAVISPADADELGIIDVHTACDGAHSGLLFTDRSGGKIALKMQGNEVFKIAVKTLEKDVLDILAANGLDASAIDFFVPHQANARIINHVRERLGLAPEKCAFYVDRFGNTSAASIPMAINALYEDGRLRRGHLMLLDAFGGGFAWGSALCGFDQPE